MSREDMSLARKLVDGLITVSTSSSLLERPISLSERDVRLFFIATSPSRLDDPLL